MGQSKIVIWVADGSDVYIPIGFVPDYCLIVDMSPSNPMRYEWFSYQEDNEASGSQEGFQTNGSDGAVTKMSDSQGITAYDTAAQAPTISVWTEAGVNAATARTATAKGTLIKATIGATDQDGVVVDRSAIFECTTAGTSSGTEPTWNTRPDGLTTDSTAVFQIVTDKALGRVGYKGIVVANEIQTNGQNCYCLAIEADNGYDDLGDVDGWPSGVRGG